MCQGRSEEREERFCGFYVYEEAGEGCMKLFLTCMGTASNSVAFFMCISSPPMSVHVLIHMHTRTSGEACPAMLCCHATKRRKTRAWRCVVVEREKVRSLILNLVQPQTEADRYQRCLAVKPVRHGETSKSQIIDVFAVALT